MTRYVPPDRIQKRAEDGYRIVEDHYFRIHRKGYVFGFMIFFVVGWISGLHRLYLGQVWHGVVYVSLLVGSLALFVYVVLHGYGNALPDFVYALLSETLVFVLIFTPMIIVLSELFWFGLSIRRRNEIIKAKISREVRGLDA